MKDFELLEINQKLLLLSLIIEYWYENGFKDKELLLYPKDFEFNNPLETSRIFYLESFYSQNKEVPRISYSIENSIRINDKLEKLYNLFKNLSTNDKLIFLNKEFNNFYKKNIYKELDIFKIESIKKDFINISNSITKYLED